MPKLSDLLVPAPLRKTPKPGEAGVPKTPAPQDLKDNPPERPTDYGRFGEKALEAPTAGNKKRRQGRMDIKSSSQGSVPLSVGELGRKVEKDFRKRRTLLEFLSKRSMMKVR